VWVAVAQIHTKLRISFLAQCHRGHTNTRGSSDSIGNSFSSMRMFRHHRRPRYKPKSTVRGRVNACGACGRHYIGGAYLRVVIHGGDDVILLFSLGPSCVITYFSCNLNRYTISSPQFCNYLLTNKLAAINIETLSHHTFCECSLLWNLVFPMGPLPQLAGHPPLGYRKCKQTHFKRRDSSTSTVKNSGE
jgi:hypothetical protein